MSLNMTQTRDRTGRLLLGLELLLICVAVMITTAAFVAFVTPQSLWKPVAALSAQPAAQRLATAAPTFGFDPFHRQDTVPVTDLGSDASETTLNLVLTGLRTGYPESATLRTPDNAQRLYTIDDEILSGVTLKAVHPTYVLISHNGRIERLTFAQNTSAMVNTNATSRPAVSPAVLSQLAAMDGQRLDAASILSLIELTPVRENGRNQGFRIASKSSGFDLSLLGLERGDIITQIGDENLRLGRPEFDVIMRDVVRNGGATMTVIRGGREVSVKVKM